MTPEQAAVVLTALNRVDRDGFDRSEVARGEVVLTELATTFGPRELQRCADRFVDCLDPDGSRPRDELERDRRDVRLTRGRDGSWRGELRLTGVLGAKLSALLTPLVRPRVPVVGADGRPVGPLDERTHGQRQHDALEDLCDRLLRSGEEPGAGGTPATVLVTIGYEDLLARTGHGRTSDGTAIPAARLLELAAEAEIIPAVLDRAGAVLSLGRTRRIASRAQTLALVARDGGCSFPGCSTPPEWCERHHIRAWADGGPTDLENLTLLCRYHHHHFASRGWTCRLERGGTPVWVPPQHVDPEQKPLVNDRIRAGRQRFELTA